MEIMFTDILNKEIAKIEIWKMTYYILLGFVISVGILGIFYSYLQFSKKKWTTIITIICGILVSIITVVDNAIFDIDHRELKKNIIKAERIISEVEYLFKRNNIAKTPKDKSILFEEFIRLIKKLHSLDDPGLFFPMKANEIISNAYAQQTTPSWINGSPCPKYKKKEGY